MYLTFNNVTKRYGGVVAVDGISYGAEKGELVSLLGPSGCGKTTTLMLLAGFETPDAGCITLDGQNLAGIPPEKRGVGVVFQNYALFPHMTVAQNVAFGLVHGNAGSLPRSVVQDRVEDLLQRVDLDGLAQRYPHELSAGQQQRVAIARSLAPQPRIICLDEPLSALDAILRERLRLEIRALQRNLGLTVLYVTHDQEEALAISDRVVVMSAGHIAQVGSPWDVYDKPANTVVAGFIGKGSMLTGTIFDLTNDRIAVQLTDNTCLPLPASAWCGSSQPKTGQLVDVVLRAERAAVVATGDEGSDELPLCVSGRLQEVEFLGSLLRLYIETAPGRMVANAPSTSFAQWRKAIGATVQVRFRAADVRVV